MIKIIIIGLSLLCLGTSLTIKERNNVNTALYTLLFSFTAIMLFNTHAYWFALVVALIAFGIYTAFISKKKTN